MGVPHGLNSFVHYQGDLWVRIPGLYSGLPDLKDNLPTKTITVRLVMRVVMVRKCNVRKKTARLKHN